MFGIILIGALFALSALPLLAAFPFILKRRPGFGLRTLYLAVVLGLLAIVPAAVVQTLLPPLGRGAVSLLLYAFIVIALIEEGAKFLTLIPFRSRLGAAAEAEAAGICASLGFAFFETVVYASSNPFVALLRAVTAAPVHASCGAWVGRAALGGAPFGPRALLRFSGAVAVHGAYDLTLLVPGFPVFIPILIALACLGFSIRAIQGERN